MKRTEKEISQENFQQSKQIKKENNFWTQFYIKGKISIFLAFPCIKFSKLLNSLLLCDFRIIYKSDAE